MPVLRARVDPETKELFLALAAAEGVTESILLRQLVQGAIGRRQEVRAPVAPDLEKLDMARLTIRMPQFLLEAAGQRAEVKGMASSRWISALVQSNLMREPVMSDREIETLQASARQLASIGRNINQIARSLNEAFRGAEQIRLEKLMELSDAINANRDTIRALVRASQKAWMAKS